MPNTHSTPTTMAMDATAPAAPLKKATASKQAASGSRAKPRVVVAKRGTKAKTEPSTGCNAWWS